MLTHIHSIYLHHDSLLHLALKNKLQGRGWGVGESYSSSDTTTFLGRIRETTTNTNFPVKRLLGGRGGGLSHVWEV